nr:altered inheritance of mitochondria protein 44-like [Aegilops tauschii subsp. strangulata]
MTSTQRSESMNYVLKKNFVSERQNLHRFVSQVNSCVKTRRQTENQETMGNRKEQNTLTFYGSDTQMAKVYSQAMYSEIRKRLKLSTLFTATEMEEPTKYLVRYNNPQKLSAWSQHAFQTIKAASVPEKYILRRYTKRPNIQPTFNRNDLRTVASNKASQYCIESSLLTLNMRVHRKNLRSQEQMARSRVVLDKLEQELDAMHSAENGGVADNETIEQDIATMLSEMNHLGAVDPFDNEEEEQQQLELAHVHTQEQQHAHMHDHELDGAVGERHDNRTSYRQQQERIGATQVSTNGDNTRNSYTCCKCGGTDGHNARTCKVGKEVSGAEQTQGKVQSSKKSNEDDEEEEFDENDDQSDEDNEDDSVGDEETETDDEAAKAQPGRRQGTTFGAS